MTSGSMPVAEVIASIIDMSNSFSSVSQVVKSLSQNENVLDTKEGISLMSLKHNVLLLYLKSLSLISARRAFGHHLSLRSPPLQTISTLDRSARGNGAGDLVDGMIEHRVILEKAKTLEARMRYQIDKLIQLAQEPDTRENITEDPLAFRPNPLNFAGAGSDRDDVSNGGIEDEAADAQDGVYHPPRLAPVPYIETSKARRRHRVPIPSTLAALPDDPTRPYAESSSGLGSAVVTTSGRAAHLKRLQEYEEENFTRLIMKKADARKRARDEADLAMGGGLGTSGHRNRMQAGTFEDAFGDVLKNIERRGGSREGDGYEELRKGRNGGALERSRRRNSSTVEDELDGNVARRKRTRIELEAKVAKKKLSKRERGK